MKITNELLGRKIDIYGRLETIIGVDKDKMSSMRIAITYPIEESYPISKSAYANNTDILEGYENTKNWRWMDNEQFFHIVKWYGGLR